jgi:hypothetical protein
LYICRNDFDTGHENMLQLLNIKQWSRRSRTCIMTSCVFVPWRQDAVPLHFRLGRRMFQQTEHIRTSRGGSFHEMSPPEFRISINAEKSKRGSWWTMRASHTPHSNFRALRHRICPNGYSPSSRRLLFWWCRRAKTRRGCFFTSRDQPRVHTLNNFAC